MAAFFRWLGTPFRAIRDFFPFSHDGRQTLIYLVFAGAGPVLAGLVWWAMGVVAAAHQWSIFERLANTVALSLLMINLGLVVFVGVRAVRIGPEGISVDGDPGGDSKVTTTTTTNITGS